MSNRRLVSGARKWVVKVGSSLLRGDGAGLDGRRVADWVQQVVALRGAGVTTVLVSSGAIATGIQRLGWRHRPHAVFQQQAAAAVGQMGLIQLYESAFKEHGLHTAQVLLTHADLADRQRYLNARSTLRTLLEIGVVPVINENDTVVTEEIRFGDNDTLAALVANLVEADLLVLLTDREGLYDRDPGRYAEARLVSEAGADDPELEKMAGPGGSLGRGGMVTKLQAAAKAARSGAATVIAGGMTPDVLQRLAAGEELGTLLKPGTERMAARKQWLAGHLRVAGRLHLDAGAVRVLRESGRSLLPVGVTRVEGKFRRGEMVACVGPDGTEIARGLVNYSAEDAGRIAGRGSDRIESVLGFITEPELIHRDNMVLL